MRGSSLARRCRVEYHGNPLMSRAVGSQTEKCWGGDCGIASAPWQKFRYTEFQSLHQRRIHEGVVVGDIQTDHTLAAECTAEFLSEFVAMGFFHHEDQIRPAQQFRCQWIFSAMIQPGRTGFDTGPISEDLLCSRAAQTVLAADEKYIHSDCSMPVRAIIWPALIQLVFEVLSVTCSHRNRVRAAVRREQRNPHLKSAACAP